MPTQGGDFYLATSGDIKLAVDITIPPDEHVKKASLLPVVWTAPVAAS
ncbi:hypothetical protein [Williamsia sp. 1135]|nr:hypothetical protein [Williamsia sp. 1135]